VELAQKPARMFEHLPDAPIGSKWDVICHDARASEGALIRRHVKRRTVSLVVGGLGQVLRLRANAVRVQLAKDCWPELVVELLQIGVRPDFDLAGIVAELAQKELYLHNVAHRINGDSVKSRQQGLQRRNEVCPGPRSKRGDRAQIRPCAQCALHLDKVSEKLLQPRQTDASKVRCQPASPIALGGSETTRDRWTAVREMAHKHSVRSASFRFF
jgi:hypothetical protein